MKKVIKWTLYFLALSCLLIYTLGGIFYPEQTKQYTDIVVNWLNTPVGIAGVSTTIGGIIAYIIVNFVIKNTKFGRKELDTVKNDFNSTRETLLVYKENVDKKVAEMEQLAKQTKTDCENKVKIMYDQFIDLQTNCIAALKTIPNKKVQALVAKYEGEFEVKKEEILKKTLDTNEYVDEKLAELNAQYQEFMKKVENMLNEERIDNQTEVE